MERVGVLINEELRVTAANRCSTDIQNRAKELTAWSKDFDVQHDETINWNSTQQKQVFFYDFKRFPIPSFCGSRAAVRRNFEGKRTADQVTIDTWMADQNIGYADRIWLGKYAEYSKAIKTLQFFDSLARHICPDGRVRAKFSPETDTGRLSSSNPNLQNIPKRSDKYGIRTCFVPADGHTFVIADYSQLELFILADILVKQYGDHSLARDLAAGDVHAATAERCGVTRDQAKTINYAVNYGKTASGLGAQILDADGLPIGKAAAQSLLDRYFAGYPGIRLFHESTIGDARKTGFVTTLLGRKRYLEYGKIGAINSASDRKAINTPIQGSAAETMVAAMLRLNTFDEPDLKKYGWYNEGFAQTGATLALQVHDELVYEVPSEKAEQASEYVKNCMEVPFRNYQFAVQLRAEVAIKSAWSVSVE